MKSLQSSVAKISLITALSTITVVMSCGYLYYSYIKQSAENSVKTELNKHVNTHIESLLPSFLLQEQKGALPYQLEKLHQENEGANFAIISNRSALPEGFKDCSLKSKPVVCYNKTKTAMAILAPISAGEQSFGHIFESRKLIQSYTFLNLGFLGLSSLLIVLLFGVVLFSLFHKLTAKTLPTDIKKLLDYVQSLLHENKKAQKPDLAFSDFSTLSDGVSELFNNYKRSQNQAVVGNFASGVLHDIKTQLQSIVSASELVEEAKDNPEKYISRLENLYSTTQRKLPELQGFIKSTLDANQEIELTPEVRDITDTVESSIEFTKTDTKFEDFKVLVEKPQKAMLVKHDRSQSIRLFFNLIKNAFEASNTTNGSREVLIRIQDLKNSLKIHFEDSGSGITGDFNSVFDPFKTSKKTGVGLGLYNAQKIASAHGWKLTANSSKRLGGACFEIIMPKEGVLL